MYARKHRLHDQGLSRVDEVIRMFINSYFKGLCENYQTFQNIVSRYLRRVTDKCEETLLKAHMSPQTVCAFK